MAGKSPENLHPGTSLLDAQLDGNIMAASTANEDKGEEDRSEDDDDMNVAADEMSNFERPLPPHRLRKIIRSYTDRSKKEPNVEELFEDAFEFGDESKPEESNSADAKVLEDLGLQAGNWKDKDGCNTAVVNKASRFVCIDYPGLVKNKERALKTLGGAQAIEEVKKKEGRLELNFRPDNPYCKSAVGSFSKANNVLIKCMRRKKKGGSSSQGDGYEYKVEVLGIIEGVFNFKVPADYQFLPVVKQTDGSPRSLINDIILKFEDERTEYFSRDVPLFTPPFNFTRHERPARYTFQPDAEEEEEHLAIGRARKARKFGTVYVSFLDKEIPTEVHPLCLENLKNHRTSMVEQCKEELIKLFERRPIWVKRSILANLVPEAHYMLKAVLPSVAYLILTGPWRNGWTRLGYDPRKHPEAKHYQTVNFRLRSKITKEAIHSRNYGDRFFRHLKVVRKNNEASIGASQSENPPASRSQEIGNGEPSTSFDKGRNQTDLDLLYQYSPSHLPPHRHMQYQVCDIFDDQIQQLAHQNDGQEKECTERDGWCVPNFTDTVRDILMMNTDKLLT